jgi:hypothetical protein
MIAPPNSHWRTSLGVSFANLWPTAIAKSLGVTCALLSDSPPRTYCARPHLLHVLVREQVLEHVTDPLRVRLGRCRVPAVLQTCVDEFGVRRVEGGTYERVELAGDGAATPHRSHLVFAIAELLGLCRTAQRDSN